MTSRLESAAGLAFVLNRHGAIARIECADITLNTYVASELEGGIANIYLRRLDDGLRFVPLLGPRSPARFETERDRLVARGVWEELEFQLELRLADTKPAWFWYLDLHNVGARAARVDLVYAQDLALAHYGAIRNNEYYTSQYVDFVPLDHDTHGVTLAVRQNLPMGGRHPWALIGSLARAVSYATDALDLYGLARPSIAAPVALETETLVGRRRQHEHATAVLQQETVSIAPGRSVAAGFFGTYVADHAAPSSDADLDVVAATLALPEAKPRGRGSESSGGVGAGANLFSASEPLVSEDLDEAELTRLFGTERREEERDQGRLLSFFVGRDRHVVLRAKETAVLRPHGHILRTGATLVPDEAALASTVWMRGVFNSLVTQGHVNINRFISATHGYLGLFRAEGQRIFVETNQGFRLLELPSAFEMSPSRCRWLYKHDGRLIEVRTSAGLARHEIEVALSALAGPPLRCLITMRVALDGDDGAGREAPLVARDAAGVTFRPRGDSELGQRFPDGRFRLDPGAGMLIEKLGGDEVLYADGCSRGEPFVVVETAPARSLTFRITGELIDSDRATLKAPVAPKSEDAYWHELAGGLVLRPPTDSPLAADVLRVGELLPWLSHNALVHYLAPHGLEQYAGGGWGTRDVCQGPVELLLALGRHAELRDLLLRVFKAQNPDGDWPQWFMFFERERGIRAPDSHGDIVFWPLLALGEYLVASEDASILDEVLPYFDGRGDAHAEVASLEAHVERALALIARRLVRGTELAAYGNGDWNDSLQPVDPAMKEKLASAWTVELHYHTLRTLAAGLRIAGRRARAESLDGNALKVHDEFRRLLVVDGVVAGFVSIENGRVTPLLHPRDTVTGISYRLLPMIHAMLYDLFTPAEAARHQGIIREHLLAPDGARLFDRPPRYAGGPMTRFQRAESSSFFGREVGIMYMHAHLRYAEAMARLGDADALFLALRQANPIALRKVVPNATLRQANCYTTSSDAVFADRYEADTRYGEVKAGRVPVEQGWRVYSSGAGIAVRLVHERFLGIERRLSTLVIDPVVPVALDGLEADLNLGERPLTIRYRTGTKGSGPRSLVLNGETLAFERQPNPYRLGAAVVAMTAFEARLRDAGNVLEVTLS